MFFVGWWCSWMEASSFVNLASSLLFVDAIRFMMHLLKSLRTNIIILMISLLCYNFTLKQFLNGFKILIMGTISTTTTFIEYLWRHHPHILSMIKSTCELRVMPGYSNLGLLLPFINNGYHIGITPIRFLSRFIMDLGANFPRGIFHAVRPSPGKRGVRLLPGFKEAIEVWLLRFRWFQVLFLVWGGFLDQFHWLFLEDCLLGFANFRFWGGVVGVRGFFVSFAWLADFVSV